MLHYFKILIFIIYFDFIFSDYNISIIEGIVDIKVEAGEIEDITFNAIENGTFLILFNVNATIMEATGEINNDIFIDTGYWVTDRYKTKVYAQNFIEGDYFKIRYPAERSAYTYNDHISIKKVDAQFRFIAFTNNIFMNIYYDNCQNPLYIFTTKEKKTEYYAYIQNHFGEVIANYTTECFTRSLDFENDNLFTEMKNDSLTDLPKCDINLIKLRCNQPSLFSLYFAKKNDLVPDILGLTIINNPFSYSSDYHMGTYRVFYFQFFNIFGNTTADFRNLGYRIYSEEDFYLEFHRPEKSRAYPYRLSNNSNISTLVYSFWNYGVSREKIAKENEKTLYENSFIIKLDPNKNKKYVKILSTINPYFYCYQFSQTEDLNYLPIACKKELTAYKNVTYINNPYYINNNKTNYTWFIYARRYIGQDQYFTYQYTNKIGEDEKDEDEKDKDEKDKDDKDKDDKDKDDKDKEEEKGNNNEEKGNEENIKNDTKSSFAITFLWISLILIVGIIIVFAYFYLKKRKNKTTSENLLNKVENQELNNFN